jgi:hypothetical protein
MAERVPGKLPVTTGTPFSEVVSADGIAGAHNAAAIKFITKERTVKRLGLVWTDLPDTGGSGG